MLGTSLFKQQKRLCLLRGTDQGLKFIYFIITLLYILLVWLMFFLFLLLLVAVVFFALFCLFFFFSFYFFSPDLSASSQNLHPGTAHCIYTQTTVWYPKVSMRGENSVFGSSMLSSHDLFQITWSRNILFSQQICHHFYSSLNFCVPQKFFVQINRRRVCGR